MDKWRARKDGFADITVRYEGIASPPLTLMVRGETRATEMTKEKPDRLKRM